MKKVPPSAGVCQHVTLVLVMLKVFFSLMIQTLFDKYRVINQDFFGDVALHFRNGETYGVKGESQVVKVAIFKVVSLLCFWPVFLS